MECLMIGGPANGKVVSILYEAKQYIISRATPPGSDAPCTRNVYRIKYLAFQHGHKDVGPLVYRAIGITKDMTTLEAFDRLCATYARAYTPAPQDDTTPA